VFLAEKDRVGRDDDLPINALESGREEPKLQHEHRRCICHDEGSAGDQAVNKAAPSFLFWRSGQFGAEILTDKNQVSHIIRMNTENEEHTLL